MKLNYSILKTEFKIFLTALMFYTRIPVKEIEGWSEDLLNKSTRYFPLIGYVVGGTASLTFWGTALLFPLPLAVLLSIIAAIFLTGAFHEDGFADFCDGFGGGYTPEKIMEIMKDSRIGTYGSIGAFAMILLKFVTLSQFVITDIPSLLISAHVISRIFPVIMIYTSAYTRSDASTKTKPIGKADSRGSLVFALTTGGSSILFLSWNQALVVFVILPLVFLVFRKYVIRKIGGYTGDTLGALQQLCEVFFYLSILAFQNF